MPTPRWLALSIVAVAVSVIAAACSFESRALVVSPSPRTEPTTALASPQPSGPASPLLTVETRGGECPQDACGSTIAVEADGRVHATAPAPVELGIVPASTLDGLATEISSADFAALKSRPFTGTCPIAFDGQETVYTFATASGAVRIASCEVVVDPAHPLFVAVSAVLAGLPAR
jgi:hypothetical protein